MCHHFITFCVFSFHASTCVGGQPPSKSRYDNWAPPKALNRSVDVDLLTNTFSDIVNGAGVGDEQLSTIEAAMRSTYNVLPKNKFGLLTHSATAYLVHEYFARQYQWHLRGLGSGPNGVQHGMAPLHKATILQDMAPQLVEGLLHAHESGHGLSLSDAAAMAATLHSLVRSDAEVLLSKSYELLGQHEEKLVDGQEFVRIILAFAYTTSGQLGRSKEVFKKRLKNPTHFMAEFTLNALNVEETTAFRNKGRINPFIPRTFSFEYILDLVERVMKEFGQWQDASCETMRSHLVRLDPNGAGRVPLGVFYAQPDMGAYRFSESAEFLRKTGVLDESVPARPQVLISNYVLGPGNCFSSSTYFQFCCVNACSQLLAEIETRVTGAAVASQDLLYAVGNATAAISVDMGEQAQNLPEQLIEKLHTVARRHDGKVPIHGRLFAQWLHFAFPVECPYPHVPTSDMNNDAITASDFMNGKAADSEEMQRHIGNLHNASERSLTQWTDEEILSLLDPPTRSNSSLFRSVARGVAFLLAIVGTIASLIQSSRDADTCTRDDTMEKLV